MKPAFYMPEPGALADTSWQTKADAFLAELAAELVPEAKEWQALCAERVPPVTDDASYAQTAHCLRTAREAKNALDARRKTFTEPLHEVKSKIDALFRPLKGAAEGLEQRYRAAMNDYETRRENERREAARKAAEGTAVLAVPPPPAAPGVSARRVWKFRVTDAAAVPRELCSPDPELIRVRGPNQPIPGVEWYEESEVRVR